jgi:probable F420-dependent oxidoreductase
MKFGVSVLGLDLTQTAEVAQAAERLGFESVWVSDHLIVPAEAEGPTDARRSEHGPVPADLPLFDVAATLAHLGALTTRIRLGTWIYVLPLRHPFVTARAFQTADILTQGRTEIGIGTGYLPGEFKAAGVRFASRGRITDEALEACRRLWRDDRPEFHGEFFDFGPVGFTPKPVPPPRIHVGGESAAAARRAVRHGTGWIGTEHTPATLAPQLHRLRHLEQASGRSIPLEVTVAAGRVTGRHDIGEVDPSAVQAFADLGVDRLIVRPWRSRRTAAAALEQFADTFIG